MVGPWYGGAEYSPRPPMEGKDLSPDNDEDDAQIILVTLWKAFRRGDFIRKEEIVG